MQGYVNTRPSASIDEVLNTCAEREEDGSTEVPGMTYEQGVKAGIEWVVGNTEQHPLG